MPSITRRAQREAQELFKKYVSLVDEDTVKKNFSIRLLLGLEHPRWFYSPDGCFGWTPHGGLIVQRYSKEPALGWSVSRNEAPLIISLPDGREAVFKRQKDAQISALLHRLPKP